MNDSLSIDFETDVLLKPLNIAKYFSEGKGTSHSKLVSLLLKDVKLN